MRYEAIPHQQPIIQHPTPVGANPFEGAESADSKIPKAPPMPTPMPKQGKKAKAEKPQPLPDPPVGKDAAFQTGNPFIRVAQTREWDASAAVPASHVPHRNEYPEMNNAPDFTKEQLQGPKTYSKAWANALGLPTHGE